MKIIVPPKDGADNIVILLETQKSLQYQLESKLSRKFNAQL